MIKIKKIHNKGGLSAQAGFIKIIILVVAALVIVKYIYDIDIIEFLTTGKSKIWLDKIYQISKLSWEKFIIIAQKVWYWSFENGKELMK
ncbi:MAG: hypothetical protein JW740_00975 [Candidatus Zambryskibacteria bacterium]|nr:hypothetical protein [Candidatus Zambryskibacteria bacterium]